MEFLNFLVVDLFIFGFFFILFFWFLIEVLLKDRFLDRFFFYKTILLSQFFLVILGALYIYTFLPITVSACFDFFFFFDPLSFVLRYIILVFFCFFFFFFRVFAYYKLEFYFLIMLGFFLLFNLLVVFDFVLVYLIIEIVSLIFYSLSALGNNSIKQAEAALKYFVMGVTSSIFFLYSLSFVYGLFGSLNFLNIFIFLFDFDFFSSNYSAIYFSFLLFFVSFFFKLGLAPFHIWLLDVYYGINWLLFFFFSVFPKMVYFFFLVKLFFLSFGMLFFGFENLFFFLCLLSIIVGSIGMLSVVDLRRFFVYGSVSHLGFIFSCFFSFTVYSFVVCLFYFIFYIIIFSSFFCLFFFYSRTFLFDLIFDLRKLKSNYVLLSFFLMFTLFSMAGIPPFVGFFFKFFVLFNFYYFTDSFVVIILILFCSVFSIFAYIRVISFLFFDVDFFYAALIRNKLVFSCFIFLFSYLNVFGIFYFFDFFDFFVFLYFKVLFLC